MTETRTLKAEFAPADGLRAPSKSMWRRFEPTMLGVGSIVALLLVWELLPRLVPLSAGTKLFFTTPSQIAGTLWAMFATGTIWAPLGVSASGFAAGLGLAIVVGLPLGVLIGRSRMPASSFSISRTAAAVTSTNTADRAAKLPELRRNAKLDAAP